MPSVRENSPRKERVRRRLVRLVFIVYWLLIFEGVLRKWVWPQFSQQLFFVRDPFVLLIYGTALANGMWPRMKPMLLFAYVLSLLALVWIAIQLMLGSGSGLMLLLAGYGWRNYFLYIPLAFLIGEQFRREDIYRLFRHTLIVIIPIAIVVAVQFFSPLNSIINSGIATEETLQFKGFTGALGHVRPNGTFTSAAGQTEFVVSSICMVFIFWILPPKQRPISFALLAMGAVAAASCLAFSVSRGMFIHAGLVALSSVISGMVLKGRLSRRAVVLPIFLVVSLVILYPIILPEAFETFTTRWEGAAATEAGMFGGLGVFGRALYGVIDFVRLMGDVPLFGYGMGVAGNAGTILGKASGGLTAVYAETDWSRHFVDMGPILAILFISFRVLLTIRLGVQSLQAARSSGNPMSVLLFGYVGVVLFYDQISGHGTIGGYAWLFVGLLMASINIGRSAVQKGVQ